MLNIGSIQRHHHDRNPTPGVRLFTGNFSVRKLTSYSLLGKNCQPFIASLGCTVPHSLKKKPKNRWQTQVKHLLLRCKQNSFPDYFFWNHISNHVDLFIVSTARFGYGPTCSVTFCIIYNSILMYHFQCKKKKKSVTCEFLYIEEPKKKKTKPYIISIPSASTYS